MYAGDQVMAKSLFNQMTGGRAGELSWSDLRKEIRNPSPTTLVSVAMLPVGIVAHFYPKDLWVWLIIPISYLAVAIRSKSQGQRALGAVCAAFWGIGLLICALPWKNIFAVFPSFPSFTP
jgi:hypothetical protein